MSATQLDALRGWWAAREPRERQVLLAGAILCGLILGWLLLWRPLESARASLSDRLDAQQQNLRFMRDAAGQLRGLSVNGSQGQAKRAGKSLLALADSSAREADLDSALKRVEPLDQHRVRVEFARAGFDTLVSWMQALRHDYGIQVEDFSARRVDGVGLVDAHVTLQDPSGP